MSKRPNAPRSGGREWTKEEFTKFLATEEAKLNPPPKKGGVYYYFSLDAGKAKKRVYDPNNISDLWRRKIKNYSKKKDFTAYCVQSIIDNVNDWIEEFKDEELPVGQDYYYYNFSKTQLIFKTTNTYSLVDRLRKLSGNYIKFVANVKTLSITPTEVWNWLPVKNAPYYYYDPKKRWAVNEAVWHGDLIDIARAVGWNCFKNPECTVGVDVANVTAYAIDIIPVSLMQTRIMPGG